MRRAPLFRSFSFQASSSSSSFSITELLSLFSFFVSVLARREEGVCFKFFYSLQKTPINLFLSRPLCVEREKKTKKDNNDKHKGDEDLFFCVWVKQKKGRKNKKEKRIELPPPKRDYTYPKVRYYRHKSSSRSVAGAKTRKRRLFSGGVDFFAGFNRARL